MAEKGSQKNRILEAVIKLLEPQEDMDEKGDPYFWYWLDDCYTATIADSAKPAGIMPELEEKTNKFREELSKDEFEEIKNLGSLLRKYLVMQNKW